MAKDSGPGPATRVMPQVLIMDDGPAAGRFLSEARVRAGYLFFLPSLFS